MSESPSFGSYGIALSSLLRADSAVSVLMLLICAGWLTSSDVISGRLNVSMMSSYNNNKFKQRRRRLKRQDTFKQITPSSPHPKYSASATSKTTKRPDLGRWQQIAPLSTKLHTTAAGEIGGELKNSVKEAQSLLPSIYVPSYLCFGRDGSAHCGCGDDGIIC